MVLFHVKMIKVLLSFLYGVLIIFKKYHRY